MLLTINKIKVQEIHTFILTYKNLVVSIKVQVIHTFVEVIDMKNLNLVNARKKKNLTQDELAKRVNLVTKAAVSNWETGYSRPRLEVALIVADILEEDVAFLFGYEVQGSHTK